MGTGDLSINPGPALEFAYARVLEFLGKDAITEDERVFLRKQMGIASSESAEVKCVGMPKPIPIRELYQPTRLRSNDDVFDFSSMLWQGKNAIIFARPGQGKTTLLRWVFNSLNARLQALS